MLVDYLFLTLEAPDIVFTSDWIPKDEGLAGVSRAEGRISATRKGTVEGCLYIAEVTQSRSDTGRVATEDVELRMRKGRMFLLVLFLLTINVCMLVVTYISGRSVARAFTR